MHVRGPPVALERLGHRREVPEQGGNCGSGRAVRVPDGRDEAGRVGPRPYVPAYLARFVSSAFPASEAGGRLPVALMRICFEASKG